MEAIISANETFDLASDSHFLVNTTEVSSIYFGIIGSQQVGVTYSFLLYLPSWSNPFSGTWNAYGTILFFSLHFLYELLVTNLCQEKIQLLTGVSNLEASQNCIKLFFLLGANSTQVENYRCVV